MKIALDGYPLVPSRAGIGQYTYHLIKALARVAPVHEYVAMYPRLTRSLRMREVPVFVYHATNYVFTHAVKRARRVVTIGDLTLVVFPEWHPRARVNSMTHEIARSLEIADHILVDSAATRDDIIKHFSVRSERISADPRCGPVVQAIAGRGDTAGPVGLGARAGRLSALHGEDRAPEESAASLAGCRAGGAGSVRSSSSALTAGGAMRSLATSRSCSGPGVAAAGSA